MNTEQDYLFLSTIVSYALRDEKKRKHFLKPKL